MKNFKIIISPAKTFNQDAKVFFEPINTMFSKDSKIIFKKIKSLEIKDIINVYSISNELAKKVHEYNQVWNKETYKAIELYWGTVFKELNIPKERMDWVNEHLLILDALYGVVSPSDLISKYRLDFKTNISINLELFWKNKINNHFSGYDIYSLSSKEFSSLLEIKFTEIEVDKKIKQIKKARGKKLNEIINKNCNFFYNI